MIWPTTGQYLLVLPTIFFAGLVDALAGGGGLISLPAYLAAGVPPHQALGSNKFSSVCGTTLATARFYRHNLIDTRVALTAALGALAGSAAGAYTVLLLDPYFLNYLLAVMLPVIAIFYMTRRQMGGLRSETARCPLGAALAAGLIIGFYDGFFGPGTGTFLIIFFTAWGYDFARANANTKVVNLASNVAAIITFIIGGAVYYPIAVPAALCGMGGNWIGSHLAIKKGGRLIRIVFLLMLAGLFAKVVYNLSR